jgi:hypothetical protein
MERATTNENAEREGAAYFLLSERKFTSEASGVELVTICQKAWNMHNRDCSDIVLVVVQTKLNIINLNTHDTRVTEGKNLLYLRVVVLCYDENGKGSERPKFA